MPKQIGLVTRALPKGLTEVLTERQGACGGCRPSHGCGSCLSTSKIKAKAVNRADARPGDLVEIHMESAAIYCSAVIFYGLPLVGLIIGAVMGTQMGGHWFNDESLTAAMFGLLGIGAGFALAAFVGNSNYAKKRLTPTVTQVLKPVIPFDTSPKP